MARYPSFVEDAFVEDAFVECPACKGEGVDLEGYICWMCKGHGQIRYKDITSNWTNMNRYG
jgi:DnaJ-class molecular chaperone